MLSTTSIPTSFVKKKKVFLNYSKLDQRHSLPGINKASEKILELYKKGKKGSQSYNIELQAI